MVAYSILMFALAALFLTIGILIYRGYTNLIHDYHQTRIKASDKKAYGKSFAKAMFFIVLTLIISGIAALFGETNSGFMTAAIVILFVGLIISFIVIGKVQKKYNGGIF